MRQGCPENGQAARGVRDPDAWSRMPGVLWGRRFGSCMAVPESDAESSKKVPFWSWNLKNGMKIGKVEAANP